MITKASSSTLASMPSLRDILHKRDELSRKKSLPASPATPEITFTRSDTFSQEIVTPPSDPEPPHSKDTPSASRRSFHFFHRASRSPSTSSPSPPRPRNNDSRLSQLLHLETRRSRSNSRDSSANVPADLPQIVDDGGVDKQEREAQWEKRATVLVQRNPQFGQLSSSPRLSEGDLSLLGGEQTRSSSSRSQLADLQEDVSGPGDLI